MAVKMKGAWWYILPILLAWGALKTKQPGATQPFAAFSEDVKVLEPYDYRVLDFPYCHSPLARSHKSFTEIQTYSSEQCGDYSGGNNFTILILREEGLRRTGGFLVTLDLSNNFLNLSHNFLNASLNYEYTEYALNVSKNKFQGAGVFLTSDKEMSPSHVQ
ncbi:hypothetical protein KC19_2G083600 [Ceratodon purpureus]|uniref:Uncharacterized protein n=1 Tax=Ceratodon purpureus TaxID=3225 RepID=A0A8T0IT81_CERPU|nr:hypothetical protein KC19_2G083600 [Ceratodon purpureus]KAG0586339.1 hypothetical protein KC19_2G083600 [Ceratodon purpureus]